MAVRPTINQILSCYICGCIYLFQCVLKAPLDLLGFCAVISIRNRPVGLFIANNWWKGGQRSCSSDCVGEER